jgi:alpha-beta hydrolase superfamily lysophospholipase
MKNTFESPGSLDSIVQICDDLDDMIHYCSDLQPTKTYVVGHSAQGGTVWYLASREYWRNKFRGLISISPMIGFQSELAKGPCLYVTS